MKVKRNGIPPQSWDVKLKGGAKEFAISVHTPLGKDNYGLAVDKATSLAIDAGVIGKDDIIEVVSCKYSKPVAPRRQKWVGGKIIEGGHWSEA